MLRLPESRPAADPAYDAAILAAYAAASRSSRQPVRLLREANPWLTRSQVHDQLRAAQLRLQRAPAPVPVPEGSDPTPVRTDPLPAMDLPDPERVARLRDAHRLTGRWLLPADVVTYGLAPDAETAERLLAAARKGHPSA